MPLMPRTISTRELRMAACGFALGLPTALACSLTLPLDQQISCSADADCLYSGGQGSCVDGFCSPPGSSDTSSTGTDSTLPTTTDEPTSTTMTMTTLETTVDPTTT